MLKCLFITFALTFNCASGSDDTKSEKPNSHEEVKTALTPYFHPDIVPIITDYCGPYAFTRFTNTDHEDNGEDITRVRMSPGDFAIASCGENYTVEECTLRLIESSDGKFSIGFRSNKIYDCAWSPDMMYMAMTLGDNQIACCSTKTTHTIKTKKFQPNSVMYSTIAASEKVSRYALLNRNEQGEPIVFSQHSNDRSNDWCSIRFVREHITDDLPIPQETALLDEGKSIITFYPHARKCIIYPLLSDSASIEEDKGRGFINTSCVNFSLPTPILGGTDGSIMICDSGANETKIVRAFNNIPVLQIAAHQQAIAARHDKKIKVINRGTGLCSASFEHSGHTVPSLMSFSPKADHLVYAAGDILSIRSLSDAKAPEIQRHRFAKPITWLHWNENAIYIAEGGTIRAFIDKQ